MDDHGIPGEEKITDTLKVRREVCLTGEFLREEKSADTLRNWGEACMIWNFILV